MQKVSLTSELVTNNSLISTDQVSYQTKFRTLLTNVSVAIAQGSKTALIGATGSGKTTFLRLLNRLTDPSVGTIFLDGKNIQEIPIQTLRRRVMLVPQEPSLLGMTVHEALSYPLKLQNLPQSEIDGRSQKWIDKLQIDRKLLNRSELELSLGQRQWIAIARALIMETEVILLDEPTSALDRGLSHLLLDTLTEITQSPQPVTVVMINHQLDLVQTWCDRLICLHKGELVQDAEASLINWQEIDDLLRRDSSPQKSDEF
ncbi:MULTISPECIES: energy-coupling factor ABC transporter ATP-binding protein [Pseudanabaena]|jgi:D-methionine transport system ATP-binding protein|uniref:energy-coupling factor ABC transporter ATP-binding protein n=1 Tax=Pseudanabaena TaxID=1152 RepID=UPI0024799F90|nr:MULTISPECIES: ATP-binding cassette domain-containing protein [Pseudanabaena]MEA5486216.1 ATP-binding cassette domain-containing protein [Pseudanabaena sp. CCNP1317]WGS70589.1 ATP-binding cassette domain-containing protein [Pseudanabaena galeata CCNP1313]